jgi:hypothetical protein
LESSAAAGLGSDCGTIFLTDYIRKKFHLGLVTSSKFLIMIARILEATDLRDKVYGLLGLVSASIEDEIKVDVGKSIVAVYTDFSRCLLKYDENVELLEHAGILKSTVADLPSWCIDVSHGQEISRVTKLRVSFEAGRSESLLPCIGSFDVGSTERLLALLGWTVDCIAEFVESMAACLTGFGTTGTRKRP